jgi:cyclopropane fatty-acyl-phospholipid synthase-like methyltransferase
MNLKTNYTQHIKDAPSANQGVGGQDEDIVSLAQLNILIANGLQPNHKLLELGCGTGRLLVNASKFLEDSGTYCGIDLVDELVKMTNKRIENLSLTPERFYALKMQDELDYPVDFSPDFICAFSVYTHMESEDVFNSLKKLRELANLKTRALVTFLPLEHTFGKVNFIQETSLSIEPRMTRVRNVSLSRSQAMIIADMAGWVVSSISWDELDPPYDAHGVRTNQSFLVLDAL